MNLKNNYLTVRPKVLDSLTHWLTTSILWVHSKEFSLFSFRNITDIHVECTDGACQSSQRMRFQRGTHLNTYTHTFIHKITAYAKSSRLRNRSEVTHSEDTKWWITVDKRFFRVKRILSVYNRISQFCDALSCNIGMRWQQQRQWGKNAHTKRQSTRARRQSQAAANWIMCSGERICGKQSADMRCEQADN